METRIEEASPTLEATPSGPPEATPTSSGDVVQVEKLVLQQGLGSYDGVADTYLDAWFQTSNMGQETTLNVRQDNIRSSLLRYDLTAIPQDAAIREATLNLWVEQVTESDAVCLQVYMLRRPWQEDLATWIEADMGTGWANGGAGEADEDYEARLIDDLSLGDAQQWLSIDIAPAVQYWVQHPEANYGLVIKGVGATNGESLFASSQWEIRQKRPKLLLSYRREPAQAQSAWIRLLRRTNPLQWLGIITTAIAVVLLLIAAGIPSKARLRR